MYLNIPPFLVSTNYPTTGNTKIRFIQLYFLAEYGHFVNSATVDELITGRLRDLLDDDDLNVNLPWLKLKTGS